MSGLFYRASHFCTYRDRSVRYAARGKTLTDDVTDGLNTGLMLLERPEYPDGSSRRGKPAIARRVGPRLFGTDGSVAIGKLGAHQERGHRLPVAARWSDPHPVCSAVCQRLQCAPAIDQHGLWRPASLQARQLVNRHATARWARAQICRRMWPLLSRLRVVRCPLRGQSLAQGDPSWRGHDHADHF